MTGESENIDSGDKGNSGNREAVATLMTVDSGNSRQVTVDIGYSRQW